MKEIRDRDLAYRWGPSYAGENPNLDSHLAQSTYSFGPQEYERDRYEQNRVFAVTDTWYQ